MHIRTKVDGGKMFNHCSRGSWHTRCYAGGLRFNNGPKWSPIVWEKTTGTAAVESYHSEYQKRETNILTNNKSKCKPENKLKRWKRKIRAVTDINNKKGKMEYGPNARDVEADLEPEEINERMELFIQKSVSIESKEKFKLEQQTKDQSHIKLWKEERKKRLTTSNFGSVMKRNPKLKVAPLVKNIYIQIFREINLLGSELKKKT